MLLGYNTNGLADHSLPAAIELVVELGYQSIAITIDHHTLNPYGDRLEAEIEATRVLLDKHKLAVVVETGARYLLDPRRKHFPTLVSKTEEQRERRIDFLRRAIDIGAKLDAKCVSLWSGAGAGDSDEAGLLKQLARSLSPVINHAAASGITVAFEPEPGHLIDTMGMFKRLLDAVGQAASDLFLTVDVGHLHCLGETPICDQLRQWKDRLRNVHIEDMRAGVHEHLMFGDGEIEFLPVIAALEEINYAGPVTVELSRHSHMGVEAAERSIKYLLPIIEKYRNTK